MYRNSVISYFFIHVVIHNKSEGILKLECAGERSERVTVSVYKSYQMKYT